MRAVILVLVIGTVRLNAGETRRTGDFNPLL